MSKKMKNPDKMAWYILPAWATRAVSLASNVIVLGYLTFYCTNMLGMSATLVGTLLLVSKLFDGVTDLFAGILIDKTNTKFGKARPYEFAIIGVWVSTVLMFSCPELGVTGKAIWIFVTYTFVNSIFATLLNSSESVYIARAIKLESDRNVLVSVNGLVVTLACTVISIVFPILMGTMGTSAGGWRTMVMIFAIPLGIIGLGRFAFVKERKNAASADIGQKITMSELLLALRSNPFIFILAGANLITNLITSIGTAVGTYYFQYIVGNISLMGVIGMLGLVSPFFLLIVPALLKKVSLSQLVIGGSVLGLIGNVVKAFAGANLGILVVGNLLGSLSVLPMSYFGPIMVISCMDYSEWKNGKRVEGVFSSVSGFATKVGAGLASALIGIIMGATGFDGTLAVQTTSAMNSIVALYSWIPAAMFVVVIILMRFYKLDKMMPQIQAELAQRCQVK